MAPSLPSYLLLGGGLCRAKLAVTGLCPLCRVPPPPPLLPQPGNSRVRTTAGGPGPGVGCGWRGKSVQDSELEGSVSQFSAAQSRPDAARMRREPPAPPWLPPGALGTNRPLGAARPSLKTNLRMSPRREAGEGYSCNKKATIGVRAQPASNFSSRKHSVGRVLGYPGGRVLGWGEGGRQDLYFYPFGGPSIGGSGTSPGDASPAGRRGEGDEVWLRRDRPVLGPSVPRAVRTRERSKTCARGRDSAAVKSGLGAELCV